MRQRQEEFVDLQRILFATLAAFLAFLLAGLFVPRFARVELSVEVDAPPSVVFAQAEDLRRLERWAALYVDDPDIRVSRSSPPLGVGATLEWDGPLAGSGVLEIAESDAHEYVAYRLNPGEPGEAVSWLELERTAVGTRVAYGFEHDYGFNLVGRYFGLLWTGVIRRDLEQGLGRLKAVVEALPRTDFADLAVERAYVEAADLVIRPTEAPPDPQATTRVLAESYLEILSFIAARELREAGPPIAVLREFDNASRRLDAGIPVDGVGADTPAAEGPIRLGRSYEGSVLRALHRGPYASIAETHRMMGSYLRAYGLERNGPAWEVYRRGADGRLDNGEPVTEIVYPVRPTAPAGRANRPISQ